jgi:hypothetical protein
LTQNDYLGFFSMLRYKKCFQVHHGFTHPNEYDTSRTKIIALYFMSKSFNDYQIIISRNSLPNFFVLEKFNLKSDCSDDTDNQMNMLMPMLMMGDNNSTDSLMMLMMMQSMGNQPVGMDMIMPFLMMGDNDDNDSLLMMVLMNSMTGGMNSQVTNRHIFFIILSKFFFEKLINEIYRYFENGIVI